MLKLVPMSPSEFAKYMSVARDTGVSDLQRADPHNPDTAAARTDETFRQLLPQGQATPHQHFFVLFEPELSTGVGWVWLGEIRSAHHYSALLYDIFVLPEYRGQGHGTRALQAAERWASALGTQYIDLYVFGHNTGAQRLYTRAGYCVFSSRMRKTLPTKTP